MRGGCNMSTIAAPAVAAMNATPINTMANSTSEPYGPPISSLLVPKVEKPIGHRCDRRVEPVTGRELV